MALPKTDSNLSLNELEEFELMVTDEDTQPFTDAKPEPLVGPTPPAAGQLEPPESAAFITPVTAHDSGSVPVSNTPIISMGSNLEKDYLPPTYESVVSGEGSRSINSAHQPNRNMNGPRAVSVQTDTNLAIRGDPQPPPGPLTNAPTTSRSSNTGARPKERRTRTPTAAPSAVIAASSSRTPKTKKLHSSPANINCDKVSQPSGLKVDISSVKATKSKTRDSTTSTTSTGSSNSSSIHIPGSSHELVMSDSSDSSTSSFGSTSCPGVHNSRKTSSKSSISESDSNVRQVTGDNTHFICTNASKGSTSYTINTNGINTFTVNNNINIGFNPPSSSTHVSKKSPQKASSNIRKIRLPAAGSTRRISAEDIEILSRELGDAWIRVGLSIGVKKGDLENIKYKHEQSRDQREMTRHMLKSWTARFGHNATIDYIIAALTDKEFGLHEVAAALPADKT